MKATGIIRRVDDLGRILIPKEIRRQFGITDGSPMEYFLEGEKIILQPYKTESVSNDITNLILKVEDNYEHLKKADEIRRLLEKANELAKETEF